MARIRTLKREFFESPTVSRLPWRAQRTFAGLICVMADDEGRLRDDVNLILAGVFPQHREVTVDDVAEDLAAISTVEGTTLGEYGLIVRYERKGVRYIQIRSWKEHQRISHPTKSKYPPPPRVSRNLAKTSELFAPDLIRSGSGNGEGSGSERARGKRAAPKANDDSRVSHADPNPDNESDEAKALREKAEAVAAKAPKSVSA